MPRDRNNLVDGFSSLSGGMDSGTEPAAINANQVAYAVNTTFRRGVGARTRPLFRQIRLDFQDNIDAEDWFNNHPITGACYFQAANGTRFLVCAAGGRFYSLQIKGSSSVVAEITPSSGRMSDITSQTWFCQASQYLVAQDGVGIPFIFDGSNGKYSSYADPSKPQVPTGKQMAYINDRLFVVATNGREILPGDLVGVSSTSVITFSEILQSAAQGGQPLSLPVQGEITGLIATAQTNTLAGQGVLLAYTRNAVCSINPVIQRSQWPSIQLQNVALIANGFTSQGCTSVNSDVWGRSVDGWRSYVMASQEFGQWGNVPQSYEIQRILEKDSTNLLDHASFVYFDNRLIGTVSPVSLSPGVYHRGMVAIDFSNNSSLTRKSSPAYEGLWTGIQPYTLVKGEFEGEERCFAFCYQGEGKNSLWEITKEFGDDNDTTRIPAMVETKAFTFTSQEPPPYKRLDDLELWVDHVSGLVDFDVKYRPDQFPCWFPWKQFTANAKNNTCDEDPLGATECSTPVIFEDQYRARMALGQPPDASEPILGKSARFGYEFQLRLQWTGNCRIRVARVYAQPTDTNPWNYSLDAGQ